MTLTDFSDFCRLCLMPLNDLCVDCANDENNEFKDTIKMVYNIDIDPVDEYSTKICLVCCDVLMYNTIHYLRIHTDYVRAVEVQKSLSRVQRIKNKLRNFVRKKHAKNPEKQPLPDVPLIDVEMLEVESIYEPKWSKAPAVDDCEMKSIGTVESDPPPYTESPCPMFFAGLTSFKQNHWSAATQPVGNLCTYANPIRSDSTHIDINPKLSEILQSQVENSLDTNNNDIKHSPSLLQMAKNFCGSIMKKHKPIESGLDEITQQMALLRFTA